MCQNLTREETLEGWRALAEILAALKPRGLGALATALATRLRGALNAPTARRA